VDTYPETSANPARLRQIQSTPGRHTQNQTRDSAQGKLKGVGSAVDLCG